MLRIGAPWGTCPAVYGPYKTIYTGANRWSRQGIWLEIFGSLTGHSPIHGRSTIDGTHIKAHRSVGGAKGAYAQALGLSRGGKTTKLHVLTDKQGRPRVLLLTAGNINDISISRALLHVAGPVRGLIANRGYDDNHLRLFLTQ